MTLSPGIQEYENRFGKPTHNDQELFELLTVGVFQVGLSWKVAASKLPVFRAVFFNMDINKVAAIDLENIDSIVANPDMIRNRRKISAVIKNARAILQIQEEFGSFANYMWQFVDDTPKIMEYESSDEVRNTDPLGAKVAKDMKKHGFSFVGPTVTYLFMKASGMIQDQVWNK